MASSIEMVCNYLGIDKIDMCGKMILIEEQHGTNANFLVNAVLSNALKRKNAVCLVLCHNTLGHYHNVGMRLGYNLLTLREKGQVAIVEPMKTVASCLVADTCNDPADGERNILPDANSERHVDTVYRLFTHVREKYEEAARFSESVVLIIDDINHLLDLGFGVLDVMYFMRYLRSFMASRSLSQLCVLAHVYRWDPETSNADMIANALKHMAHLCLTAEPFETGHSGDTSGGKLMIHWKVDSIRLKYHLAEMTVYLFKLLDWQIRITTPGGVAPFS
ncbi:elongator complex protein 6 [Pseudomyrmex gracilis]|uniref:elongator complex protein 6 n=1 Tax=Pseudomyrmex gracilis TaxID=219809 RepID=UPI000995CB86|nr:elongator complex protein 6 [Pseudomyrmex gracilis]XP_020295677.1 elongator complex protein 6 [Pseudomyrmex gracilis]XP_020295678.1 elongator complex protein 6 [Pseudomyrmex gracilis]